MKNKINRLIGRVLGPIETPEQVLRTKPSGLAKYEKGQIGQVHAKPQPGEDLPRGQVTVVLEYDLIPGLYPVDAPSEQIGFDQRSWDDGNIDIMELMLLSEVKSAVFELPE